MLFKSKAFIGLTGAFCGAFFLSFLSGFQKMLIHAPISPQGFIVPTLFGGFTGTLIVLWTQRLKEANITLQASNNEKELLLRELHHRVKNNLQLISSIIHLSSCCPEVRQEKEQTSNIESRILIISHIQESMYQKESLGQVSIAQLIDTVISFCTMSFCRKDICITKQIPVEEVCSTPVPLGLLIYELFSNSIIHAFQASTPSPSITIAVTRETISTLLLRFSDNGQGFSFDPQFSQEGAGIGLQLITALSRQLNGTFAICSTPRNGMNFTLRFPIVPNSGDF